MKPRCYVFVTSRLRFAAGALRGVKLRIETDKERPGPGRRREATEAPPGSPLRQLAIEPGHQLQSKTGGGEDGGGRCVGDKEDAPGCKEQG